LTNNATKTDHLTFYGFYTEEIARVLGIQLTWSQCRSIKDVIHHLCFPNNTFKYRASGRYKVEGCQELIDKTHKEYNHHQHILYYGLTYMMYRVFFSMAIVLLGWENILPWWAVGVLLALQFMQSRLTMLFTQYAHGLYKVIYLSAFTIALPFIGIKWFIPMMVVDVIGTVIRRKMGFRTILNDLSARRRYRKFFYQDYVPLFRKIRDKKEAARKVMEKTV
jgi:hypothetical protein